MHFYLFLWKSVLELFFFYTVILELNVTIDIALHCSYGIK